MKRDECTAAVRKIMDGCDESGKKFFDSSFYFDKQETLGFLRVQCLKKRRRDQDGILQGLRFQGFLKPIKPQEKMICFQASGSWMSSS